MSLDALYISLKFCGSAHDFDRPLTVVSDRRKRKAEPEQQQKLGFFWRLSRELRGSLVEMARESTEYDNVDPRNITRKVAAVHAIMIVMHALAIASSFVITTSARAKYTGTTVYNTVKYNGTDTLVYGTRYMVHLVLEKIMEYGDTLNVDELIAAFRETMRAAAVHVTEGYAITENFNTERGRDNNLQTTQNDSDIVRYPRGGGCSY